MPGTVLYPRKLITLVVLFKYYIKKEFNKWTKYKDRSW